MKWKKQMTFVMFLILTYFLVITQFSNSNATDVEYTVPYRAGGGPTINGTITASEWVNAIQYTIIFQFNDTENPIIEAELYLLHNGSAIFIGLNITQADNQSDPADAFYIYFDEKNNGQLAGNATLPKEEGAKLTRDGNFTDLSYNGSTWINDEDIVDLTKGPSNGATNGVGGWEFVMVSLYNPINRKSINTSDFDINLPSNVLEPTVRIGFDIEYYDADINQTDSFTTSKNRTVNTDPSKWDVLICGTVPPSQANLGAIWAYIAVGMIVPAGLIVFLIIWIMRRKLD